RHPAVADLDEGGEVERGEPLAVAQGPVVAAAHAGAGYADDAPEHDQTEGEDGAGPGQPAEQARPVGGGIGHTAGREPVPQSLVKAIFTPCRPSAMPGGSGSPGT